MNKTLIVIILALASMTNACSKSDPTTGIAALNIIHADIGVPSVSIAFSSATVPYYLNQAVIPFGSGAEYGLASGNEPIAVVSSDDTAQALFQGILRLKPSSINSLYLFGQGASVDTLLREDNIPRHTDSTAGVRFINLSPDSGPLSINLQGNDPGQHEFSNLGFRQLTDFKNYSFKDNTLSYTFEIRDQTSGDLLLTFTWGLYPFKNHTIVIDGLVNGVGDAALNIFQVNNF